MTSTTKYEKEVAEQMSGAVTIVVLGASGDLAKKKTFPALFRLYKYGLLPKKAHIIGYARTKMDRTEYLSRVTEHIKDSRADEFKEKTTYIDGQYDQDDSWEHLRRYVEEIESKANIKSGEKNRIFYMALPPSVFLSVATGLKKHLYTTEGHVRIVIEKPFGRDTESCRELLTDVAQLFKEDEIYRIDHYLGKEMAKDIMTLRFANVIFKPLWTRQYIQSVQITLKEPFGTEKRGGYFDQFGIIRDVMQNHLLQLLSLLTMEQPASTGAQDVRNEKVRVLQRISPIVAKDSLLGQYTSANGKPGYLEDDTLENKKSNTPTFASLVLWIDNERWNGVPFILTAGKALDEAKVDIRIQFRNLVDSPYRNIAHNELILRVQPDEGVHIRFNNKEPGLSEHIFQASMDHVYKQQHKDLKIPDAYETLILDVLRNNPSNFVRDDELIAAWKIFTPLLHKIDQADSIKVHSYAYGSHGPELLEKFVSGYVSQD
ncbi:Glucose-6-phosphate 1-dehydrogenase [Apophysomyces sp. BC1034]|nr:Glucose-6-phosphate 1-dehydrogenase [Apophysomyces sp. BC1015]KAG0180804.1 Glucose-6-phosphate 1-dehydrogenase [Apophysomyces sp. BC1021]KAG0191218.1 Glucose-6-phosphate 1-dehydrogenase [Apophysomyces sp. BC1034]